MAAIGAIMLALLKAGDHIVSSQFVFGNTNSLLATLEAHGHAVSMVDATDVRHVEAALTPATRVVFVETIANPRVQVADLARIGALCRERGILYVVDNTMTSPWLFQPRTVGAGLVVNALTKYIGGHGNALAGSITDTGLFDWTKYPEHRRRLQGPAAAQLGPAAAAQEGPARLGRHAGRGAGASHRGRGGDARAAAGAHLRQRAGAGAVAASSSRRCARCTTRDSRRTRSTRSRRNCSAPTAASCRSSSPTASMRSTSSNRLKVVVLSSNLGDNRTLAIPVAQTIFYEMGPERRAAMGIAESLIRISVGIEDRDDLIGDFRQALAPA